ncbi:MAG: hypothetical protein D3917_15815 [Candidatus Electrothrix sp. AX5]|nr:hypothetical protein [Candidatus Electrothrix sp. AX5]
MLQINNHAVLEEKKRFFLGCRVLYPQSTCFLEEICQNQKNAGEKNERYILELIIRRNYYCLCGMK